LNLQTLEDLEAGKLHDCRQLKLCCNLIEFPNAVFSLADTLEILDLSGNQLSSLPDDFIRLNNLKILFLSDNQFKVFPEVLGRCKSITMIGFKSNQIHTIAETALHSEIRWLILTNNLLTQLPASIGNCWNMQKLALAGNQLTSLPIELSNCKNIGLIRISANQITEFPEWLLTIPKLSWLAFAGNPFCYKPIIENSLAEINWDDLSIEHQLGQGASGIISKAIWQKNSTETIEVAVKEFKGAVTSDGLPEDEMNACILASSHKNLIPLLGKITNHAHKKEGLVLGLIPPAFKNLGMPPSFETCTRDVFETNTVFTSTQIVKIVKAAASVGSHLHSKGILHGDFYAHNTLINADAEILIGDFGAASLYNRNDSTMAESLEKIEVNAWACLLEDLLLNLRSDEINNEIVNSLNVIKKKAIQTVVINRPSFNEICQMIGQINC
jgi:hypothetical protein